MGYILESIDWLPNSYKWRVLLAAGSLPCVTAILLLAAEEKLEIVYQMNTNADLMHEASKLINQRRSTSALGESNTSTKTLLASGAETYRDKLNLVREALEDKDNIYSLIAAGGSWFCFDAISFGVTSIGEIDILIFTLMII
jgi:hypothetical protein